MGLQRWESAIEQQIKDGVARGLFDDLPGKGKPSSGLSDTHDEDWWLKAKLRAEQLSFLPPTLRIRREVELAREAILSASSPDVVRRIVEDINIKIKAINSRGAEGPPSTTMVLDVAAELVRWHAARNRPAARSDDRA